MGEVHNHNQELKRPLTLHFPLKSVQRLHIEDVVQSVGEVISQDEIKAVQFTWSECRITVKSADGKQKLKAEGINVGGGYVRLQDADRTVQSVMIKDAPVEMDNSVICSKLEQFATVVQGSMTRGMIKGTSIENGVRFVHITNIEADIPTTMQIGRFTLRLFGDQNKNPSTQRPQRRCFRCFSLGHLKWECKNEMVCKYCGQSGHKQDECDDYQELEPGKQPHTRDPDNQSEQEQELDEKETEVFDAADHTAVVLGASIVKHMDFNGKATVIAKSGTCAADVDTLLNQAEAQVEATAVKQVIMHLGTNDMMTNKGEVDMVRLNAAEAVRKVKDFFPAASIGVAAVPPRKGKSTQVQRFNADVKAMNHYMQLLTERDERLTFLDTHKVLAPGEFVVKKLFSDRDSSGVHLSTDGMKVLQQELLAFLENTDDTSLKRQRSDNATPSSVEKTSKASRLEEDSK